MHVGAGYSKVDNMTQFAISGYYEMGPFTISGYIQRDKDYFGLNTGNRTNYRIAGMCTMGQMEFHLNYGRAGKAGNIANSEGDQATAAVNYNLSSDTKVYAFLTRLHDDGARLYINSFGAAPAGAGTFTSMAVGLRHNF